MDDDAFGRKALASILEANQFRVVQAADGHEALAWLAEGVRPDLIILDLIMPGLDGWAFLRRFKSKIGPEAIPIIVVSACDTHPRTRSHRCVVGSFQKPLRVQELLELIRSQLPR
ncbi:MAG: response regulator [Gemmataceae bacterium]